SIHINDQAVVGYVPFPNLMADDRLRRRDVGVIGYIFRKVVRQIRLAFYLECNRKKKKKKNDGIPHGLYLFRIPEIGCQQFTFYQTISNRSFTRKLSAC